MTDLNGWTLRSSYEYCFAVDMKALTTEKTEGKKGRIFMYICERALF